MPASKAFTRAGLTPLWPNEYARIEVRLPPSTSIAKGTVLGELNLNSGVYGPYQQSNTDGTQIPKVILEFDCLTDARGFAWLDQAFGTNYEPFETVAAYSRGVFRTSDLVGFDANAASQLGRFVQGDVNEGIFQVT